MTLHLSREELRKSLVLYQHLAKDSMLQGKHAVLKYIQRVGCIQYDTLDVVGRNADLVLQSRIADYNPSYLHELLYKDRLLVDEWDKVMSIYAVDDWPYFQRFRASAKERYSQSPEVCAIIDDVRKAIRDKGSVTSADLAYTQSVDWSWAPTRLSRAVLESMYFWGELIVENKTKGRKVYDFARNHIDETLLQAPDPNQSEADFLDWYLLRRIGSIGVLWNRASDAWLGIPGCNKQTRTDSLKRLINQGLIEQIEVSGLPVPLYTRVDNGIKQYLNTAVTPKMSLLAPLDNLLWDRKLIKSIFDFEYRWEVYKPVKERVYGYYVLPVLFCDHFVARCEPVLDKKTKTLVLKNWWWEKKAVASGGASEGASSDTLEAAMIECFQNFMQYVGAHSLKIDSVLARREGLGCLRGLA